MEDVKIIFFKSDGFLYGELEKWHQNDSVAKPWSVSLHQGREEGGE